MSDSTLAMLSLALLALSPKKLSSPTVALTTVIAAGLPPP
eukprot:CAMPEP_0114153698 /NCGR_PEP_ID=MMETSP0043_2-20121206/24504_1 /TAXON_ID=464988 /ORGANISM="Hemiselmis andersenii, Strain CCMP644" /LENGTH=39 /DNA_ID= /DNA_START= /DNA_END= /DNA_ORIENTATION=